MAGVTEAERGILQVKSTLTALYKQNADLESRISEWASSLYSNRACGTNAHCRRQQKIAIYIRNNQKELALSHLRSKKGLQGLLSKRTLAFENLQAVLLKIEAADSDVAILSAYQSATSSLKSLLAHPSLQKEQVENTTDAMQDALADQREIEGVIKIAGDEISSLDLVEVEIQKELEEMQKEAKEERKQRLEERAVEQRYKEAVRAPAKPTPAKEAIVSQEAEQLKEDLGELSLDQQKQAMPAQ